MSDSSSRDRMRSRLAGRRAFLRLNSLGALSFLTGCGREARWAPPDELWLSAGGKDEASYGVSVCSPDGEVRSVATGARGHEVLPHPQRPGRVLLVGRRPGRQMFEVDLLEGRVSEVVDCQDGHHLCGHACFNEQGSLLYSTESNFERGEGRIVVRDALDYRLVASFDSHGVGPHQVVFMPGGRSLAVANGGLLTHPDSGRTVLNGDSMRSTLALVNPETGELLNEFTLREPKASIRHLSVGDTGALAVGCQMQREAADHDELVPLAALYDEAGGLRELSAPDELMRSMNDYVGSVCVSSAAGTAAFSSPRGDLVLAWDVQTGAFLGYHRFADVSGLTTTVEQDSYVLSSSSGQLRLLDAVTLDRQELPVLSSSNIAWDNHLRTFSSSTPSPFSR